MLTSQDLSALKILGSFRAWCKSPSRRETFIFCIRPEFLRQINECCPLACAYNNSSGYICIMPLSVISATFRLMSRGLTCVILLEYRFSAMFLLALVMAFFRLAGVTGLSMY